MSLIESPILHQYRNGNVDVTIHENGTKIREWPDGEDPVVIYPESCDLKVTQFCDMDSICVFCHEMSNKEGKHGDLDLIRAIWKNQLPGTELAIGGGNPLAHPDIDQFLWDMSRQGVIPNLTVNSLHVRKHAKQLIALQQDRAIYGLGISYRGTNIMRSFPDEIDYSNVVFHMILGLNTFQEVLEVVDWCRSRNVQPKILLLGYKQFGNGVQCYTPELQAAIDHWKNVSLKLSLLIHGLTLSFDNLAIAQLELENQLGPQAWSELFQGPDQTHTFYVDAIKEEVAGTSCSVDRFPITYDDDIVSIFNRVKIPHITTHVS